MDPVVATYEVALEVKGLPTTAYGDFNRSWGFANGCANASLHGVLVELPWPDGFYEAVCKSRRYSSTTLIVSVHKSGAKTYSLKEG